MTLIEMKQGCRYFFEGARRREGLEGNGERDMRMNAYRYDPFSHNTIEFTWYKQTHN